MDCQGVIANQGTVLGHSYDDISSMLNGMYGQMKNTKRWTGGEAGLVLGLTLSLNPKTDGGLCACFSFLLLAWLKLFQIFKIIKSYKSVRWFDSTSWQNGCL